MEKMDVPLLSRRESSLANNDLDDFDRTPVSTKGKGRERERENGPFTSTPNKTLFLDRVQNHSHKGYTLSTALCAIRGCDVPLVKVRCPPRVFLPPFFF